MNKGSKDQKRKIEEVQKLLSSQKVQAATLLLNELLHQRPKDPKVLVLLGIAAIRQHDLPKAQDFLRQALHFDENISEAHFQLASVYLQQKKFDEAIEQYQKMNNLDASHFQAQINLALAFENNWRYEEAAFIYQRLLEEDPENTYVYLHISEVLIKLGKIQEAISYLLKAQELEPKSAMVFNHLGRAFSRLGELSKAIKYFEKALLSKPHDVQTLYNISQVRHYKQGHFPEIRKIQEHLQNESSDNEKILCHYALGKVYDETEHYERAFYHFSKANTLSVKHDVFDEKAHQDEIKILKETFDSNLIQQKAIFPLEGNQPIFIVGLPYTGKTLLESILTKHHRITHTGQQRLLLDLSKKACHFPEGIKDSSNAVLQNIAQEYLFNLNKLTLKKAPFICDVMPDNYLLLGLIAILFPKAKIIHCTRHPMDICLMHYFHWDEGKYPYAHELHTLGKYYQDYAKLMGYWQSIGIQNRIEIKYEALIEDPQETLVNLFEELDIPIDLNLKLPTLHQYEINRWEKYRLYLQPLIDVLYQS